MNFDKQSIYKNGSDITYEISNMLEKNVITGKINAQGLSLVDDEGKFYPGVEYLKINTQMGAKERQLDEISFQNEIIKPIALSFSNMISDLEGEYNLIDMEMPEGISCCVISSPENIGIRLSHEYDMLSLSSSLVCEMLLIQKSEPKRKKVFLGGTLNGSMWRDAVVNEINIDSFNPIVEDWTEKCAEEEIKQREECDYCLYVLTPRMEGCYSVAEVVDDANKRPEKTILCIAQFDQDFDDLGSAITYEPHMKKSLQKVSEMVEKNGAKVFQTMQATIKYINEN